MPKKVDIVGNVYGQWTVKSRAHGSVWECICSCGNTGYVNSHTLKSGKSSRCVSCGFAARARHGKEGSRVYNIWGGIKQRCLNSKYHSFHRYGGRGIEVCKEWLSFDAFYADMGDPPAGASIDRIDNDGNYCKENCRWGTSKQQCRNKSTNRLLELHGDKIPMSQMAEQSGINYRTFKSRIRAGWSIEDAANRAVRSKS